MSFDRGDTVRFALAVTPTAGDTTVTAALAAPDNTITTPAVSETADGYETLAVLDQAGRWIARWEVAGTGAGVEYTTVYVRTPPAPFQ